MKTEQDWVRATEHVQTTLGYYIRLIGTPNTMVGPAITTVFEPLLRRYNSGERTDTLYDEMMAVK